MRAQAHLDPKAAGCSGALVLAQSPISPTLTIQVHKWLGDKLKPTVVTSDMKKDKIASLLKSFHNERAPGLLLISYETLLGHLALMKTKNPYGVIVCDEAHRLKNTETKVWKELITLEAKCKIMVTGTPVQNDLNEFYALLAFCMPDCLGDPKEFRKASMSRVVRIQVRIQAHLFLTFLTFLLRRTPTRSSRRVTSTPPTRRRSAAKRPISSCAGW